MCYFFHKSSFPQDGLSYPRVIPNDKEMWDILNGCGIRACNIHLTFNIQRTLLASSNSWSLKLCYCENWLYVQKKLSCLMIWSRCLNSPNWYLRPTNFVRLNWKTDAHEDSDMLTQSLISNHTTGDRPQAINSWKTTMLLT